MGHRAGSFLRGFVVRSLALTGLAMMLCLVWAGAATAVSTGTIEGEVTAADGGAPLEGVKACVMYYQSSFARICDTTDSDGAYAVADLLPNDYILEFTPGPGMPYFTEYWDDQESYADAEKIELDEGETVDEIDAELEGAGVIEGSVTAASGGAALAGVEVCAWSLDGESLFCDQTGVDGGYEIAEVWPGEYEIEFDPRTASLAYQWWHNRNRWFEADALAVGAEEVKPGIDAALPAAGAIEGTVTSVLSGAPLEGIWVCAVDAAAGQLFLCNKTRSAGRYWLGHLNSAQYKVVFSPDFAEWIPGEKSNDDGYPTQFWNAKATLAEAEPIGLTAPNTVTGIDARLGPPPLAPQPVAPVAEAPKERKKTAKKACRKGFKKKKVRGKQRCVKARKGKKGKGSKKGKGKAGAKHRPYLLAPPA